MKILVGLLEHMGDIVACEPVARYLKLRHPGCEIAWAVASAHRALVDANPAVDETILVDCLRDWVTLREAGAHDRVFDLHVNDKPCPRCDFVLAKPTGDPDINIRTYFHRGALLEAFSEGAGLPRLSSAPRLHLGAAEVAVVDALGLPERFCVIHRVSNSALKDWPHARWEALARFVREHLGFAVVEVGAGDAARLPAPIAGCISLVNRLPLLATAEVIRRAAIFLGVDSGPAHLANALRVPGMVLLGRLPPFDRYCPYTGFYAAELPWVRLLRHSRGGVAEIGQEEATAAVRALAAAAATRPARARWPDLSFAEFHARQPVSPEGEEIAASPLFNGAWYALHHPEVLLDAAHPAEHYLRHGATSGHDPGPDFSTAWYLETYLDVARAHANPLLHYLRAGRAEGRLRRPPPPERQGAWQEMLEQRRMTAEQHARLLAMEAGMARLAAEKAALEAELAQIRSGTPWWLTAPILQFGRRFRRRPG